MAPATPSGAFPTASGSPIVLFVSGSMRLKVPSLASVTKTMPSSVTEMPSGPLPAGIEATTFGLEACAVAVGVAVAVAVAVGGRRCRGVGARLGPPLAALEHAGGGEPGGDQAEHEDRREDDPERAVAARRAVGGRAAGRAAAAAAAAPPAASASCAARANSPAVWWRSSGFFASPFSTTAASAGGSFGFSSSSDGGGSLTWANIVADVGVAQERARAREREVEDAGERVDVGARVGVLALDLPRARVVERADEVAGGRGAGAVAVERLDEPEVGQVGVLLVALAGQQDVAGLDVAVDEAAAVGGVERGGDLADDPDRARGRERALARTACSRSVPSTKRIAM